MYQPQSSGKRFRVGVFNPLLKGEKFKPLFCGLAHTGGRNISGRISVRHKGGGLKRRALPLNTKKYFNVALGFCFGLAKDFNKTSYLMLVKYANGAFSYQLASNKVMVGFTIIFHKYLHRYNTLRFLEIYSEHTKPLGYVKIYSNFFDLEFLPLTQTKFARAAGVSCYLEKHFYEKHLHEISLPSGELKHLPSGCTATLGCVSNRYLRYRHTTKAGLRRLKGVRPTTRGVAMNPVDHPNGGRKHSASPEMTP